MGPGPNDRGASRGHIMDASRPAWSGCGLDHIDLYQIHGNDTVTPIDETLRALDDLVRQGLVRYIGVLQLGGLEDRQGARASATTAATRGSRPCRPTTRSPAATSSARSCR